MADGDTITVLASGNVQYKIRLNGVDCPESKQAFGSQAKQFTSNLVFGKTVTVKVTDRDRYGRLVAEVLIGEKSLQQELLRAGMAWHYKQYSKDPLLAKLEQDARAARRGLWADKSPTAPWSWRKERK
ncbi:MAG: thermonuclease family protein [Candidatus Sericytochromatia bacterium]